MRNDAALTNTHIFIHLNIVYASKANQENIKVADVSDYMAASELRSKQQLPVCTEADGCTILCVTDSIPPTHTPRTFRAGKYAWQPPDCHSGSTEVTGADGGTVGELRHEASCDELKAICWSEPRLADKTYKYQ